MFQIETAAQKLNHEADEPSQLLRLLYWKRILPRNMKHDKAVHKTPDMKRHHNRLAPLEESGLLADTHNFEQSLKGVFTGLHKLGIRSAVGNHAAEHQFVMVGPRDGEVNVGLDTPSKERARVPGTDGQSHVQPVPKQNETLGGNRGKQGLFRFVMTIHRGRTDTLLPGRFLERKTGHALFLNDAQTCCEQGLLEIPVVIGGSR